MTREERKAVSALKKDLPKIVKPLMRPYGFRMTSGRVWVRKDDMLYVMIPLINIKDALSCTPAFGEAGICRRFSVGHPGHGGKQVRAVQTLGPLRFDECFGYAPLLGLGGSRRAEHLRKYKLREHIAFIAQAVGKVGK